MPHGIEANVQEKVRAYLGTLQAGNDILLDSSFSAQCGAELEQVRRLVLQGVVQMSLEDRLEDAAARVMLLKLRIWATEQKIRQVKAKEKLLNAVNDVYWRR